MSSWRDPALLEALSRAGVHNPTRDAARLYDWARKTAGAVGGDPSTTAVQAREFLAQYGIGLEYVKHLPKTHLDGAALRLPDHRPVIGLTLRYDRIDNFWFTLLHELGHVSRHLGACGETGFVDDLTLRGVDTLETDATEQEADRMAQDALIPPEIWGNGDILESPSPMAALSMAAQAQVHPAIVAGRVRYELRNYRLLSQFVGTGEVRRLFEGV